MSRLSLTVSLFAVASCVGSVDAPPLGPSESSTHSPAAASDSPSLPGKMPSGLETPVRPDPNRPTLRRLNRSEYDNTLRDLLGTTLQPSAGFPADDVGYGFDNVGDVLSLSPLQLELYQKAARAVIGQLFEQNATGEAMRARLIPCDPAGARTCAETTIRGLLPRAFRRPVGSDELGRVLALYDLGASESKSFQRGMALALEGVLLSPHFLFRVERDPDPASPAVHPLSDHELATRLSYFLWSTAPDQTLRAAADAGKLQDPEELSAQVERMLQDPRSSALTRNFAGQWLLLGALSEHQADSTKYPRFDAALRDAMREETSRFFASFLASDLPVRDLARADWTYVDARLANLYGLPPPAQGFARVSTAATERRGLLGQASFLTVTSHAATTSPVKRGKFVLERLLCAAPPDPPPGIPPLDSVPMPGATLRERLEEHRKSPSCAGCHSSMDPIGFGLEPFDAIGGLRTKDDGGFAVDSAGELPDGRAFGGPRELAEIVAADPRFARCVAEKLWVYALGRGVAAGDQPYLDDIDQKLAARGGSPRALIELVVVSEPFRMRRGEPGAKP